MALKENEVLDYISKADEAKKDYHDSWKVNREFYLGNQHKQKNSQYIFNFTINHIYNVIDVNLALLLDDIPCWRVYSEGDESKEITSGERITRYLKHLYQKLDIYQVIYNMVFDSLLYGTGICKVYWDDSRDNEDSPFKGEVAVKRVSPFLISVDPSATSLDNCQYIVEHIFMTKEKVKKLYKVDAQPISVSENPFSDWQKPISVEDVEGITFTKTSDKGKNLIEVKRLWFREEEDINVYVVINNKVIKNYKSPFIDITSGEKAQRKRFPFVFMVLNPVTDEIWGISEILPLIEVQKVLNRAYSLLMEMALFHARPKILNPKTSGISAEMWESDPGQVIDYNLGSEPRFMTPPVPPSYLFELALRMENLMKIISGIQDVVLGRVPSGISAASAIAELQEAAQTKIRRKLRNRNEALKDMGELILSRMVQFYPELRIGYITKDGERISITKDDLKQAKNLIVEVGTMLPANQTAKFQQLLSLVELGVIPKSSILDLLDFPDRDIIKRQIQIEEEKNLTKEIIMRMGQEENQSPLIQGGNPFGL